MTFGTEIVDVNVVAESNDGLGDYLRLPPSDDPELGKSVEVQVRCSWIKRISWTWWLKVAVLCLFLAAVAALLVIFGGPFLLKKVVIPILEWEMATFSIPILGLLIFVFIAICPVLLLPSSPCMWIAGMSFGYGYGFLLIMAASSIGMSLPFFIGHLFRHKLHKWLEKWPKQAALVRLASEGNWFHQFRAVTLLRVSPFPYIVFNYAAVATNVKYFPYICGSLIGSVPETFMTIYTGRLLRTLADVATEGGFLSMEQVLYNALCFGAAVAATAAFTIYAKRALQTLKAGEGLSVA
ncbi:uncharacterized protein A4U43_C04F28080 [Asparagus officinalis]|uniref:VTT domain-containing protein n=1 Tax=Asparagus officinalis TaxID=4686 RepID=A0A5P1F472_ASPOF|nr:uncharacterized protein LOC109837993 [Asparagus officinalis]XP_020261986.1 uncharacterized protein LOC109837993 [Asparagus officinalis]XP_020261987.1 uncharacterized protein LOC109837993 [Asparagus officinalis]XP_020261988.1 uncharacterized protein LOC109837993 [Asparagus officinalis]ONK73178.1 uncharacterized protein A4U43_C04F28080 [Asparagus officinalis]